VFWLQCCTRRFSIKGISADNFNHHGARRALSLGHPYRRGAVAPEPHRRGSQSRGNLLFVRAGAASRQEKSLAENLATVVTVASIQACSHEAWQSRGPQRCGDPTFVSPGERRGSGRSRSPQREEGLDELTDTRACNYIASEPVLT
jgi:hypothetical protein